MASKTTKTRLEHQPLTALKGVGPKLNARLQKLGLHNLADALWHLPLRYQNRNVTADRPQQRDLPEADLAAIRAHNRLDVELYAFARELFAERYAEHAPHFQPLPPPSMLQAPHRSVRARLRGVWERLTS